VIEMKVGGLALDEKTRTPVLLLEEVGGDRVLPIWIGPPEASAIAMELAGKKFPRPLTHDLLKTVIMGLGAEVSRVAITGLVENTFFAKIFLRRDSHLVDIDARSSDAIALALRAGAPIFVAEELMKAAEGRSLSDEERARAVRRFMQGLDPEDFGKFSL
jgi:bifunctional DNase/RNase